jgi:hypothetical protein
LIRRLFASGTGYADRARISNDVVIRPLLVGQREFKMTSGASGFGRAIVAVSFGVWHAGMTGIAAAGVMFGESPANESVHARKR